MPDPNAALGKSQLKRIEKIIKLKNEKADYYREKLQNIDGIVPPLVKNYNRHTFMLYSILTKNNSQRQKIITELKLDVKVLNKNVFNNENKFTEDVFVARAFKPLKIVLELMHKKAQNLKKIFIFLGKSGQKELLEASKSWDIKYKQWVSVTSSDSKIIEINKLKKKN